MVVSTVKITYKEKFAILNKWWIPINILEYTSSLVILTFGYDEKIPPPLKFHYTWARLKKCLAKSHCHYLCKFILKCIYLHIFLMFFNNSAYKRLFDVVKYWHLYFRRSTGTSGWKLLCMLCGAKMINIYCMQSFKIDT